MESNKLMKVPEFCKFMGIGANKAYELCHDPSFYPAVKLGRLIRINKPMLDKWIEEQCTKKAGDAYGTL